MLMTASPLCIEKRAVDLSTIEHLLTKAMTARAELLDSQHESAFRFFNGFTEGCPDLVIDVYASTAVLYNYADRPEDGGGFVRAASNFLKNHLNWLRAGILKTRNGRSTQEQRGKILFGGEPDRRIKEHGICYALDLTMNQDASLYIDTRDLRRWTLGHLKDKTVINAFAYTGSLGVAALGGGASRVVQLDRNRRFLNIAKTSYMLNGFPIRKEDFIVGDFFSQVGRFKRTNEHFDCVFLDPPFFASTSKGRVDQVHESARLINKVRPLINDGGYLVTINNALFVSGADYMEKLKSLCKDGYLKISELIPVPQDFTGYPETRAGEPVTDPAPFNHSTKIAVLEVKRKN